MSRISTRLQELKEQGRKALVPYIVAGDPLTDVTVPVMHELVASGADIIELGVPFSDPMAEGPVIQLAHERALMHKVSLRKVLEMVKEFRQTDQQTPVVLMGYANPIEVLGYQEFAFLASDAGIDGVLTVDLPPEEAQELNVELKRVGIDNIFLIAPTTVRERVQSICALGSGYLYYVSLKGVTGAGHLDITSVEEKLQEIKQFTDLPVCVGFGIKDAESARGVAAVADGVVVGSVLVNKMAEFSKSGSVAIEELASQVASIISEMRSAMDE